MPLFLRSATESYLNLLASVSLPLQNIMFMVGSVDVEMPPKCGSGSAGSLKVSLLWPHATEGKIRLCLHGNVPSASPCFPVSLGAHMCATACGLFALRGGENRGGVFPDRHRSPEGVLVASSASFFSPNPTGWDGGAGINHRRLRGRFWRCSAKEVKTEPGSRNLYLM